MRIFRNLSITLLAILTSASGILLTAGAEGNADKLGFKVIERHPGVDRFHVADLDGDGQVEFLEIPPDHHSLLPREISRVRFLANSLWHLHRPDHWIMEAIPIEIDTIPGREVALLMKDMEGDSMWVEVISGFDMTLLCRTGAIRGTNIRGELYDYIPGPAWDGHMHDLFSVDLDNDGTNELVIPVQVAYDCYPRGVFVFDYPSGRLRWQFPTAGNPFDLQFADAGKDGLEEIYFWTGTHDNSCVVKDMMDTTGYGFAVNYDGTQRWSAPLRSSVKYGGSNIVVCDCDADSDIEVYYTTLERKEGYDQHFRVIEKHFASDNEFITNRAFVASEAYNLLLASDVDRDGKLEIVMNNRPRFLDPVTLETKLESNRSECNLLLIKNLVSDEYSGPEVVISSRGEVDSLLILDHELIPLACYTAQKNRRILRAEHFSDAFGSDYLGVVEGGTGEDDAFRELVIAKIERNFITLPSPESGWEWGQQHFR